MSQGRPNALGPAPGADGDSGTIFGRAIRRADASMSLLIDAASNPVDPGYAEAAARREKQPADGGRFGLGAVLAGILVAVLTAGTVWAARELRAPAPDVLEARTVLEDEIRERSEQARAIQEENAELVAEIEALAAEALADSDPLLAEVARLAPVVGTAPVSGPGLVITLTDSPRAQAGDPDAQDERVHYVDLQILTNGLWQAGAEAMAVNGHRLTSLSAVRFAGEAILVELTPLVGPYRVEVVGDPDALQTALARTAAARHLTLLRDTYAIGVEVTTARELELAAVPAPALRSAGPAGPAELPEAPEGPTGGL